jgi:hypothetical protein
LFITQGGRNAQLKQDDLPVGGGRLLLMASTLLEYVVLEERHQPFEALRLVDDRDRHQRVLVILEHRRSGVSGTAPEKRKERDHTEANSSGAR